MPKNLQNFFKFQISSLAILVEATKKNVSKYLCCTHFLQKLIPLKITQTVVSCCVAVSCCFALCCVALCCRVWDRNYQRLDPAMRVQHAYFPFLGLFSYPVSLLIPVSAAPECPALFPSYCPCDYRLPSGAAVFRLSSRISICLCTFAHVSMDILQNSPCFAAPSDARVRSEVGIQLLFHL